MDSFFEQFINGIYQEAQAVLSYFLIIHLTVAQLLSLEVFALVIIDTGKLI